MTDNGRPEGSHHEPDEALETRVARALGERDEIVAAALRGDDARDGDEDFVESLRTQWLGAAPALSAVGASDEESAAKSAPRPHWARRRWMPMAAAAALLIGAVTIGVQMTGERGGDLDPGRGEGPSGVYLGTDGEGEVEVFDGTVDWGSEAPVIFDVVIRDADPSATTSGAVVATYPDQSEAPWPYPGDLNELPERFTVEAYAIGAQTNSPPQASRTYRRR